MSIFDMGKNLDDYKLNAFTGKLFDTGKVNINGDMISKEAVLDGKFPKRRGRKKMHEKFFYNPKCEYGNLIGVDVANGVVIGDVVVATNSDITGYITKIRSATKVKIKWEITYGTI